MSPKNEKWISASDVGRAAFCGHSLELKNKGIETTQFAKAAMKKGDIAHDEFNRQAEDKRCYIASHLYGIDDSRTDTFRAFRDAVLMKNFHGRMVITIYYKLSPFVITIARKSTLIDTKLKYIVNYLLVKLENHKWLKRY